MFYQELKNSVIIEKDNRKQITKQLYDNESKQVLALVCKMDDVKAMKQVEEQHQTNRDLNMVISLRMNKIQKYDQQRAKLEQLEINNNLIKDKTDRIREMRNEQKRIKHQLIEDNISRNHEESRR